MKIVFINYFCKSIVLTKVKVTVTGLSVKNEKSFVVLRVVNSCAVAPEANGNLLKTTKNDASVHGYGTKSIRKTAKKYNGICEWHYDETAGNFSFTILFNKDN